MKTWLVGAVAMGMILADAAPVAADREVSRLELLNAFGAFSTTAGCVTTDIVVSVNEGTSQQTPGRPETLASVWLTIFGSNTCTDETVIDLFGDVQLDPAAVAGGPHRARVTAVIDVYERVSDRFFDVPVDVAFHGTGVVTRVREVAGPDGCLILSIRTRTERAATAVGVIDVDGTNMLAGQAPSGGLIQTERAHEITDDCPPPG